MDIEEIKKRKEEMAAMMFDTMQTFEKETGLEIRGIELLRKSSHEKNQDLVEVKIILIV